ncbi:MAG: diacylglycerol/lipid kinase family protein [Phycisphaerales bacterium JB047]
MRISIIYNPRSGRGKALRLSEAITRITQARGHKTTTHDIHAAGGVADETIHDCDRLVIVGGDGTVHHLLPQLAQTPDNPKPPFYHCGTGTANLISHAFKMTSNPARLVNLLERDTPPVRVDLPLCNGHPFLIMTSLGMDASVIHRFEESRKLGGYRAYINPIMREIIKPRFAQAQVQLDNNPAPGFSKPGILVIANMPNYGGHFNPCPNARWNDATLDIAHIPGNYSLTSGLRYLALRARIPASTTARAEQITITATNPSCVQIDGEKPTHVPSILAPDSTLNFTMSPQGILVHAPLLNP